MIPHIKLKRNFFFIFYLLIFFLSCKNSEKTDKIENNLETNLSTKITDSSVNNKKEGSQIEPNTKSDKIVFELVSVKQISNNKPVDSIISKLNAIKVEMVGNTIFINNFSASYSSDKSASKKFFGKNYIYNYYVDFLVKNYNIDIKNQVDYIEVSYEDAQKYPFKDFFLEGGVTLFMNDYLLLQYSDYIVSFKKSSKKNSKSKSTVKLPFNYQKYLDECYLIDNTECNEKYPFYSSKELESIANLINENINKNIPNTIFCIDNGGLPFETYVFNIRGIGDQDYLQQTMIINIKNNTLIAKQIIGVSSDGDAPESVDNIFKSYVLNVDLKIDVFEIRFGKVNKKVIESYQIKPDGSIVKVK